LELEQLRRKDNKECNTTAAWGSQSGVGSKYDVRKYMDVLLYVLYIEREREWAPIPQSHDIAACLLARWLPGKGSLIDFDSARGERAGEHHSERCPVAAPGMVGVLIVLTITKLRANFLTPIRRKRIEITRRNTSGPGKINKKLQDQEETCSAKSGPCFVKEKQNRTIIGQQVLWKFK
jgi:hypothetical protein